MYNCTLDTLRGYSYKLPDSIVNSPHIGGLLLPLANSLQLFNGQKIRTLYEGRYEISAVDMRGRWIGIGQRASPGQLISAVLLDAENLENPQIFNYQKTEITHIAVAQSGEFFCTVGGASELSQELIIIETQNQSQVGTKVFYSKSFKKGKDKIVSVKFSNNDPTFFALLTKNKVIFYKIDTETGTVQESVARTSRVREYNNFIFSPDDRSLYCCSINGDISQVSVEEGKQVRVGPKKRVITKGINNLKYLHPNHLLLCGKEGMLGIVELADFRLIKEAKLQEDQIISISQFYDGKGYVATNKAVIYCLDAVNLDTQLYYTCCSTKINALAFLKDHNQIFGSASGGEIVIWRTNTLAPILRISVAKLTCISLHFPKNSKYIVSGWNDDCIRIYSPKNGQLLLRIQGCNLGQVSEIISNEDSTSIICGGSNGVIRMWNLIESKIFGLILGSLAHHMQRVNCLRINPFNHDQLVSCCDDGQYAVWSLSRFELKHFFRVANYLSEIRFIDELRIRIAGGGNCIYQCFICDGIVKTQIEVSGSCINTFDECNLDSTGERLIFFGGDLPKLYYYDSNETKLNLKEIQAYGEISKLAIAPDKSRVIVGTVNGIILSYSIFPIKQKEKET